MHKREKCGKFNDLLHLYYEKNILSPEAVSAHNELFMNFIRIKTQCEINGYNIRQLHIYVRS